MYIFVWFEVFLSIKDLMEWEYCCEYNDVGGGGFCDRFFKGIMIFGFLIDLIDMYDGLYNYFKDMFR